jgi:hypothetical protein
MKKIFTGSLFSKSLIIFSIFFFIYKYWSSVLDLDETKLIQTIFERVLLLTPSSQQWTGEFVVNIFSGPLDFIAVFSPGKFSSIVTFWLDHTNSSLNFFRAFYYLVVFLFILFINTKQGLLSALVGTFLMEYFRIIPQFRLEVLLFYVLILSLEKKSIALFLLASGIKLLSIIFLPLAVIAYTQNAVSSNFKKAIVYFLLFNSSIIIFPVLTSKAFLGDIYIKLFARSTADFSFFANGFLPFLFFLIILTLYFKDLFRKKSFKAINRDYLSVVLMLFYCLLFIKLTGYFRHIFIILPFVLKFIFDKVNFRVSYLSYSFFFFLCLSILFSKSNYPPRVFSERDFLRHIYSSPDYAIDTFKKRFGNIPATNFYYQQILDEEKRNAKLFLDNY